MYELSNNNLQNKYPYRALPLHLQIQHCQQYKEDTHFCYYNIIALTSNKLHHYCTCQHKQYIKAIVYKFNLNVLYNHWQPNMPVLINDSFQSEIYMTIIIINTQRHWCQTQTLPRCWLWFRRLFESQEWKSFGICTPYHGMYYIVSHNEHCMQLMAFNLLYLQTHQSTNMSDMLFRYSAE